MNDIFPPFHWTNLLFIPGLLIGYTIHELAHAFAAYFLGDYSQVERGKITLNPMRHISWFGTFAFILFGFGWPKPLEVNIHHLKRKHLDIFLIALAGPIASFTFSVFSLLLTLLLATILLYQSNLSTDEIFLFLFPLTTSLPKTLDLQALAMALTSYIAIASFWLTLTSVLPLPGLDGYTVITSLATFFREQKKGLVRPDMPERSNHSFSPINLNQRRNNISDIHFKLGAEYHQAHQYDDAIARYRQAINIDRRFGPAYINLGLAYLGKGRRREAIHAFRGAVQYADDQKSQHEAWYQLHQLSEVSHLDETAQDSLVKLGASPWTDTRPRPNWLTLGIGMSAVLLGGIFVYGYLLFSLIEMLRQNV
jgi:Zn-dependent protease